MPNRLEKTYDRVLFALKELGYKLDPKGFEPTKIALVFKVAESGCIYHIDLTLRPECVMIEDAP